MVTSKPKETMVKLNFNLLFYKFSLNPIAQVQNSRCDGLYKAVAKIQNKTIKHPTNILQTKGNNSNILQTRGNNSKYLQFIHWLGRLEKNTSMKMAPIVLKILTWFMDNERKSK